MIIRKQENWLRMLFIWRGSVLPRIMLCLVLLFFLAVLVVYFRGSIFSYKIQLNPGPFTLFGIALAIFLSFRNNVSYDRFWEARKLWGSLLNTTRSLTRQAQTLADLNVSSKASDKFVNLLIAFTYCCKHQLRLTDPSKDLEDYLGLKKQRILKVQNTSPIYWSLKWVTGSKTCGQPESWNLYS